MKTLFKTVMFAAVGAVLFASCNDSSDNYDYEAEYLKQDKAIDSLLSAQKLKIDEYTDSHSELSWKADTVLYPFYFLDKKTPRGIQYAIINEATDETYEYQYNPNTSGVRVVLPKVKLKYTASLLNGTVVESELTGSDFDFNQSSNVINTAWLISFVPYSVKFNGDVKLIGGLTEKGLKKGNKVKVIVPSIWAYGSKSSDKIPANSPLVYEFEVLEIK